MDGIGHFVVASRSDGMRRRLEIKLVENPADDDLDPRERLFEDDLALLADTATGGRPGVEHDRVVSGVNGQAGRRTRKHRFQVGKVDVDELTQVRRPWG